MTDTGQATLKNTLQGSLSGSFVEFDHLPWLLANLDKPGRSGPDWPQVRHSIRTGMEERGQDWINDLPPNSVVEMPPVNETVVGARQLCGRLGLIEGNALTSSGLPSPM